MPLFGAQNHGTPREQLQGLAAMLQRGQAPVVADPVADAAADLVAAAPEQAAVAADVPAAAQGADELAHAAAAAPAAADEVIDVAAAAARQEAFLAGAGRVINVEVQPNIIPAAQQEVIRVPVNLQQVAPEVRVVVNEPVVHGAAPAAAAAAPEAAPGRPGIRAMTAEDLGALFRGRRAAAPAAAPAAAVVEAAAAPAARAGLAEQLMGSWRVARGTPAGAAPAAVAPAAAAAVDVALDAGKAAGRGAAQLGEALTVLKNLAKVAPK